MSREDQHKYMKTNGPYSPWEEAYQLAKPHYTREEINKMHFCEIDEILNQEDEVTVTTAPIKELNDIELNVLEVALDHMQDHLDDVILDSLGSDDESIYRDRLEALKTLSIKLL